MGVRLNCTASLQHITTWDCFVHDSANDVLCSTNSSTAEGALIAALEHLVKQVEMLQRAVWEYEYAGTDE